MHQSIKHSTCGQRPHSHGAPQGALDVAAIVLSPQGSNQTLANVWMQWWSRRWFPRMLFGAGDEGGEGLAALLRNERNVRDGQQRCGNCCTRTGINQAVCDFHTLCWLASNRQDDGKYSAGNFVVGWKVQQRANQSLAKSRIDVFGVLLLVILMDI